MHIVLQGARGYSASKAASDSAHSPDSAVTSCRRLISFSLDVSPPAAKVAFCRKVSEDRYQFRRLTVLNETTPTPPRVLVISRAVEKYREILVSFVARCAKWVMTNS
jgi:hypothetical protein